MTKRLHRFTMRIPVSTLDDKSAGNAGMVSDRGLTTTAERRMALEERSDNVGKKPAMNRRKKKGDDDVDVSSLY